MPVKHGGGGSGGKSDPYDDRQCRFVGEGESSFGRGRRIRNRLVVLPWAIQEDLRLLYEPRRERPALSEERVRRAHKAYLLGFVPEEKKSDV